MNLVFKNPYTINILKMSVWKACDDFLLKYQDSRTKGWPLMISPEQMAILLISYTLFATKIGPWLMKNRKPYNIMNLIQAYNVFQVVVNFYMVYKFFRYIFLSDHYKLSCQPLTTSKSKEIMDIISVFWLYYVVRIIDFCDTVFFILRKKFNNVSYLHVYHHISIVIFVYIQMMFYPDSGHSLFTGLLNTFVHGIMYIYYGLALLGPQYQKYLWWKHYLTTIQLIQFALCFVHNFQVLFRECDYPRIINVAFCLESGYFFYLFSQFYVRSYVSTKKPETMNSATMEDINNNSKKTPALMNGATMEDINSNSNNKPAMMNGATNINSVKIKQK